MAYNYLVIFSLAAFCATLLGGLFAIRFKNKIHLIMAFAAGILLGVVSFDIFPELFEQLKNSPVSPLAAMVALVAGFLLFHILEKTILIHHAQENAYARHSHPNVGVVSALALTSHSFMDGASIGIGFQINAALGILIAVAVISHDFCDGMNTATLMLASNNSISRTKLFLFFDALAPVLGIIASSFIAFSSAFLTLYLGFFAGFLLYIGASDILPEAHSRQSSLKLVGLTILGVFFIFIITRLV